MRHDALTRDLARSATPAIDTACDIRRNGIAAIAIVCRVRRGCSGGEWLWFKSGEKTGDDISGSVSARPATASGCPGFVIPRDNGSVRAQAGTLVDNESNAVVLPRHLVLPRKLDAHGFSGRLRHQRGVVGNRVCAIDAVTTGS